MSRISATVIERIEKLKSASKLSWIGVVNRLRTSSYAYKMGIDLGYRNGMMDPEAIVHYLDDKGLKEVREVANDLWEKRAHLKYPPAALEDISKEEFCSGFAYGVLIQQEKHNLIVSSLREELKKAESMISMSEEEVLQVIGEWKHFWSNQHQSSKEDEENYRVRALGVDSNMAHHLANMIAKRFL